MGHSKQYPVMLTIYVKPELKEALNRQAMNLGIGPQQLARIILERDLKDPAPYRIQRYATEPNRQSPSTPFLGTD